MRKYRGEMGEEENKALMAALAKISGSEA